VEFHKILLVHALVHASPENYSLQLVCSIQGCGNGARSTGASRFRGSRSCF